MTKEEIANALSTGISLIKYIKLNGEEREAQATRDPLLIPERVGAGAAPRVEDVTTVRYYEPLVNGWRAFLVENLIAIERA